MKKIAFWTLAFLLIALKVPAFGASILLINDSYYELTAEIFAASGVSLGSFTINPGEQKNFVVSLSRSQLKIPGNISNSITPYSVVWRCSYKGNYSVCTGVSPGSLVRASSGDGGKYCEPKPDEEEDLKYRCPACPPCPPCPTTDQKSKTSSTRSS